MLYGHGGDIYSAASELGVAPSDIIDFSSNVNPFPMPHELRQFLCSCMEQVACLPEVDSSGLRHALARRFSLQSCNFIIGAGTTEWIYRIARIAMLSGRKKAIIPVPAYSDYMDASERIGLDTVATGPWIGKSARYYMLEDLIRRSDSETIIYLCNPNNPTGSFLPPGDIINAVTSTPDTTWVIDESYAPFIASDDKSSILAGRLPENCIILRSFSKIYGIPGLRLGYVAGHKMMMETLEPYQLPWSVGRLAQLAGEYIVKYPDMEDIIRLKCIREKKRMLKTLTGINRFEYIEGNTHFMLFRLKQPWSAPWLASILRKKRILIRDCSNFTGLGDRYVRISLRTPDENDILAKALTQLDITGKE